MTQGNKKELEILSIQLSFMGRRVLVEVGRGSLAVNVVFEWCMHQTIMNSIINHGTSTQVGRIKKKLWYYSIIIKSTC